MWNLGNEENVPLECGRRCLPAKLPEALCWGGFSPVPAARRLRRLCFSKCLQRRRLECRLLSCSRPATRWQILRLAGSGRTTWRDARGLECGVVFVLHDGALRGSAAIFNDGHAWFCDEWFVGRRLQHLSFWLWSILRQERGGREMVTTPGRCKTAPCHSDSLLFVFHSLCATLSCFSRGISFSLRNSAISLSSSCSLCSTQNH